MCSSSKNKLYLLYFICIFNKMTAHFLFSIWACNLIPKEWTFIDWFKILYLSSTCIEFYSFFYIFFINYFKSLHSIYILLSDNMQKINCMYYHIYDQNIYKKNQMQWKHVQLCKGMNCCEWKIFTHSFRFCLRRSDKNSSMQETYIQWICLTVFICCQRLQIIKIIQIPFFLQQSNKISETIFLINGKFYV